MTRDEPATDLLAVLGSRGLTLATAESCTGGMVAAAITDIPGASTVFAGGVVAYSNDSKQNLLHVSAATLAAYGAVSARTALDMARGATDALGADCAISITGIAGPDGGSAQKPVGTVWFGFAIRGAVTAELAHFDGNRSAIRQAATTWALHRMLGLVNRTNELDNPRKAGVSFPQGK